MVSGSQTWTDENGWNDTDSQESRSPDSQTKQEEQAPPTAGQARPFNGYTPYVQKLEEQEEEVKLWLITFTDVIALMLTFFVLLYSMSVPEEDKWEEVSTALSSQFTKKYSQPYRSGPQDTISIDKIDLTRALSLPYLKSLIEQAYRDKNVTNFSITQLDDRLVLALPDDFLNVQEGEDIQKSREAIAILADTVGRIKNRVEIIGHGLTWPDSLDNAVKTATILREIGYAKDIVTRASAPPASGRDGGSLTRSIDIVIMRDNGLERELLIFE